MFFISTFNEIGQTDQCYSADQFYPGMVLHSFFAIVLSSACSTMIVHLTVKNILGVKNIMRNRKKHYSSPTKELPYTLLYMSYYSKQQSGAKCVLNYFYQLRKLCKQQVNRIAFRTIRQDLARRKLK